VTRRRQALGREGEDRAAQWYLARGYEVLGRNWRCHEGELDLVLRRRRTVVFCEVKTRSSLDFGHPAEAVTREKQQRVRRLATRWIAGSRFRFREIRFDVVAVLPGRVDVIEGAF
jgi:putative endonuclease